MHPRHPSRLRPQPTTAARRRPAGGKPAPAASLPARLVGRSARHLLVGTFATALAAQAPAPPPTQGPAPKPAPPVVTVEFDPATGWPIVAETPVPELPAGELRTEPRTVPRTVPPPVAVEGAAAVRRDATPSAPRADERPRSVPALASGMEPGSPLLEVFQACRAPGQFRSLGGVSVWWRLTMHGASGEEIGVREITHTADCGFAQRDRLQHADGRVYGRSGASVFAERQGMPWPTLAESAEHELALFGTHLRLPWCFGDSSLYVVVARDVFERAGETLRRVVVERRPEGGEIIGPEAEPKPRDRFELLYEPSSGQPREFVHRFAAGLQTRRVLLEDWQEVESVRMPFRRVYVDENLRRTTVLEILRVERVKVGERDFRLH